MVQFSNFHPYTAEKSASYAWLRENYCGAGVQHTDWPMDWRSNIGGSGPLWPLRRWRL